MKTAPKKSLFHNIHRKDWLELVIVLVVCIQLIYLGWTYIRAQAYEIWTVWGQSAVERSARLQLSTEAWEYIDFVREIVPAVPDVTVVLPYREQGGPFTYITLMQYYFFPREVDNCSDPTEVCIQQVSGETKYILGGHPPEGADIGRKEFIPFDESRGIYIPLTSPED